MSEGKGPLWMTALKPIDEFLRSLNDGIRKGFRYLRILQVFLAFGVLVLIATAVCALFWPRGFLFLYPVATLYFLIPQIILLVLVSLPLRARSLRRLVNKGYPANAKELAIRAVARKLHDESIETEELLWDTAVNESRKAMRKFQARAEAVRRELEGDDVDSGDGEDQT